MPNFFSGLLAGHVSAQQNARELEKLGLERQLTTAKIKQLEAEEALRQHTLTRERTLSEALLESTPAEQLPPDVQGPTRPGRGSLSVLDDESMRLPIESLARAGAGSDALKLLIEALKEQSAERRVKPTPLHFGGVVQTEEGQGIPSFEPFTGKHVGTTMFPGKPPGKLPADPVSQYLQTHTPYQSIEEALKAGPVGAAAAREAEEAVRGVGPTGRPKQLAQTKADIEAQKQLALAEPIAEIHARTTKAVEAEAKLGTGVNLVGTLTKLASSPDLFLPEAEGSLARGKQAIGIRQRAASGADPVIAQFEQIREGLRGQLVRIGGDVGNFNESEQVKATRLIPDPFGGMTGRYPFVNLPDSKEVAVAKLKMLGEFLQAGLEAAKGPQAKSRAQTKLREILGQLDRMETSEKAYDPEAISKLRILRDAFEAGEPGVTELMLRDAADKAGVGPRTIEDWITKHAPKTKKAR